MAVRRKKRVARRRHNPIRTTGALVVNPKRRRRKAKAAAPKRRRARRAAPKRRRARRAAAPRANRRRRARANPRKKAAATKRRYKKARRIRSHGKALRLVVLPNPLRVNRRRRSKARRNPLRVNRRRRSSHRSNPLYRQNSMIGGLMAPIQRMVSGLPVVGGFLSSVLGFAGPALFGALGVEPTIQFARYFGPYVPMIPTSIFYPLAATIVAAIVHQFAPVSPEMKKNLAIAIASGGGAVGYYKWRTGSDAEVIAEAGMLEMSGVGGFGEGMLSKVVPYGASIVGR